jgi:hypothetical protein
LQFCIFPHFTSFARSTTEQMPSLVQFDQIGRNSAICYYHQMSDYIGCLLLIKKIWDSKTG